MDRCETWCRHFVSSGGGKGICDHGGIKHVTERGVTCMGKKQSPAQARTSGDDLEKIGPVLREFHKRMESDTRCRELCRHFADGTCMSGAVPAATEDGASCMGVKEIPKSKLYEKFNAEFKRE